MLPSVICSGGPVEIDGLQSLKPFFCYFKSMSSSNVKIKYLVFIAKGKLLIDTIFYPCQFLLDSTFKGIVQLDVRGVKSRLR
jgi:hypothetical protein